MTAATTTSNKSNGNKAKAAAKHGPATMEELEQLMYLLFRHLYDLLTEHPEDVTAAHLLIARQLLRDNGVRATRRSLSAPSEVARELKEVLGKAPFPVVQLMVPQGEA